MCPLYAQFYIWGLWNDGNPTEERFICTKDKNDLGTYRVTPGVAIEGNYGSYFTADIKITHDWGVDPALHGRVGIMEPAGIINKYETLTINIGPVSYPPCDWRVQSLWRCHRPSGGLGL